MPVYKIHYFNNRGRAETIRMILALKEQQFTDRRVSPEDWPEVKKSEAPMGQLPFLEVDSEKLVESGAIIRYLGREFDLIGKSSLETARIDAIFSVVEDLMVAIKAIAHQVLPNLSTEKAEFYKNEFNIDSPALFRKLENQLLSRDKGQGYFFGNKITVADVHFYSIVDMISDYEDIFPGFLDPYPGLMSLKERVRHHPHIKEYLDARKPTLI